jgi:hypothetical protein
MSKWLKSKLGVRYRPITSALYKHLAFKVMHSNVSIDVFEVDRRGNLYIDSKHPYNDNIKEVKKNWKLIYTLPGYQLDKKKSTEYIEVDRKSVEYDDLLLDMYAEPSVMDYVKPKTKELFKDIFNNE